MGTGNSRRICSRSNKSEPPSAARAVAVLGTVVPEELNPDEQASILPRDVSTSHKPTSPSNQPYPAPSH